MFKNYLKVALRNIIRYKGYSFINIAGMAIGIACCILIFLYVQDELSYDRYHEKSQRTYRVTTRGVVGGNEFDMAISSAPLGATMVREFPEVMETARFRNFGFPVLRYKDKVFSEERFFWTDSTFFDLFTVVFLQGDAKTALTQPNTVVLTRSMANKYFGDENPIGKTLNADNRRDYEITGVVEDVPRNSHFHYDFLGSLATFADSRNTQWISNNYYTYIVLKEGATLEEVEDKIPDLVRKYVGPQIQQAVGFSYDQMVASGGAYGMFLQPLTDIHLHSDLDYEIEPNGDASYVQIFGIIALAILGIACINFMNLATARSANRAKEVGIRKTLGSNRAQLIRQFLAETIFTTVLAVGLAILLAELLLPLFNNLSDKNVDIHYFDNLFVLPVLIGLAVVVGLVSGSYPAFFLAAFSPVKVLKGTTTHAGEGKSSLLRTSLVVFQFSVSIMLFIGTLMVNDQLEYIQSKKLGFNKEQIVIVHKTDDIGAQVAPFMQALRQHSSVIDVSNTTSLPGLPFNSNAHQLAGVAGAEVHILWEMRTDYDFASTYEIAMADGRYFSREWTTDSSAVVLNETAVQSLGLTDPIGKELVAVGPTPAQAESFTVIGVVEDFHFESLHQKIRPMATKLFRRGGLGRYVSVRILPEDTRNILAVIEETWQEFAGDQVFEYTFFDQDYARLYRAEETTAQILTLFSVLAIMIACLGLFGLASFTTEQRTKEIGIRKVLGASVPTVVMLLSRQFTKWVLLANILAWPLAYYIMNNWLQSFAYRTGVQLQSFFLGALLAFFIAVLTVSYHTVRAAVANPVDSLRYE